MPKLLAEQALQQQTGILSLVNDFSGKTRIISFDKKLYAGNSAIIHGRRKFKWLF